MIVDLVVLVVVNFFLSQKNVGGGGGGGWVEKRTMTYLFCPKKGKAFTTNVLTIKLQFDWSIIFHIKKCVSTIFFNYEECRKLHDE